MRLSRGPFFQDLGTRFGISLQLCSNIFSTWNDIFHKHLQNFTVLPINNKKDYACLLHPKTTCIIDCTEMFIQRPFSLEAWPQTYSSYKSHNTAKVLVAIPPSGWLYYVYIAQLWRKSKWLHHQVLWGFECFKTWWQGNGRPRISSERISLSVKLNLTLLHLWKGGPS